MLLKYIAETGELTTTFGPLEPFSGYIDVCGRSEEPGLAGWTVYLDQNQNGQRDVGELFTITDAEGNYWFTGLPPGTYIVAEEPQPGWTQIAPPTGTHTVSVRAEEVVTGIDFGNVRQPSVNSPPVISSTPRGEIQVGATYRYQVVASDPNGDPLTFTLDTGPAGMTIDPFGMVQWQSVAEQLGGQSVTVRVDDGLGGSATQEFTVTVTAQAVNQLPRIISTPPVAATVGAFYHYELQGLDPDGDPLVWGLDQAPAGMSIDSRSGRIVWTPVAGQLGTQNVVVSVLDGQGGRATQSYSIAVHSVNVPPAIVSVPLTQGSVQSQYVYAVRANDVDGDRLSFQLNTSPYGMTIDTATGLVLWTPTDAQTGLHSVVIQVDDGRRGIATQSYQLVVEATVPNQPPLITSTPVFAATVGSSYTYQATATDPDGDPISFALLAGPAGMTVDAVSGLVQWPADAVQAGRWGVTVAAGDGRSGAGIQTFTLTASVNRAPTITSTAVTSVVASAAYRYDVRATDPDGDRLTYTLTSSPAGMTLDSLGRIQWSPGLGDIGTHPVVITVSDGRGGLASQSYDLQVTADTRAPQVGLQLSANPANVGTSVTILVSAVDDVGVAAKSLVIEGVPVVLDTTGRATVPVGAAGTFHIEATATDAAGNVGRQFQTMTVIDPNVVGDPVVAITSPTDGQTVTALVDVIGTVSDPDLLYYTLSVAPLDGAFTEIARGTQAVTGNVLGSFDPSLLPNGDYFLQLYAIDTGGNDTSTEVVVSVAGDVKLGNFTLSFTDLTIPISGIPIVVARTYDSLIANQKGELGYGWRLEIRDTDLRTSVAQTGMEDYLIYNPFFSGARVYVTVPGGGRQAFTFQPRLAPGLKGSFLGIWEVAFVADPGVTSTLSVANADLFPNDYGEFYGYASGLPYNPACPLFGGTFTLTTKDGTKYEIDGTTGDAHKISDPNGNALTFTDNGIFSTAGSQIRFERDPRGRITAVIDPMGKRVEYRYDAAGDLVAVSDRDGNTTSFVYRTEPSHYLEKVVDPLGRTGVRSVYDDQGRLIQMVDADGKVVGLVHDPEHFTETIVDQMGNPTIYEYDIRGNIITEVDAAGGTTIRTYDDRNNMLTETDSIGNTITFTYDSKGNTLTETDPLGNVTRCTYGVFNQVLTTTDPLGNTTTNAYDANGNLLSTKDAIGSITQFTYSAAGDPLSIVMPGGATTSFQYDAAGNVTSQTDALGNVTSYTYDANDRLLEETLTPIAGAVSLTQYTYDANGNTLVRKDVATDQVLSEWRWDHENRLVQADMDGDGTFEVENQYDADGIRVAQTVDGEETRFLIDSNRPYAQVLEEYTAGGIVKVSYAHGLDLISQNRLAETGKSFYHVDGLGSTRALTDSSGLVTDRYLYDAFGRTIKQVGSMGNVYLFAGEQRDSVLGLDYLRARWMSPSVGRFVSRDSFEGRLLLPLTLHRYLYAGANPIMNTDPLGLQFNLAGISAMLSVQNILASLPTTAIHSTIVRQLEIVVALPEDRDRAGTMTVSMDKRTLPFNWQALGRGTRNAGPRDYNPITHCWWEYGGDTPTGRYKGQWEPAGSGYGNYGWIRLTPIAAGDHAWQAYYLWDRSGIGIHSGGNPVAKNAAWYPLTPTHGCIRISDVNMQQLANLAKKAKLIWVSVIGAQPEEPALEPTCH